MNILIAGVGGQGTLLASKVLGEYGVKAGFQVKINEIHGMSQRGGSVVTHVRIAKEVFSPTVTEGEADVLLAFEELEAARFAHYLKKDGTLIVNTQRINPLPVINGACEYPEDLRVVLGKLPINTVYTDAFALARRAGNIRTVNTVMIGRMTKLLALDIKIMTDAVKAVSPPAALEYNLRALEIGFGSHE
ncbi:MAG: indolepyruvate oxidoreductase subunit beta [Clostridiales bacterium]|jgi:indolepyruvate ferredoxin oxidoreductase beta subunit|nr:indolepyruvate oxidoreductase subunit beta [Clostridiales bacterium]